MKAADKRNMKPGDWICPTCGDLVFASNEACRLCKTPKVSGDCGFGKQIGNWFCDCGFKNREANWVCGGDGDMGCKAIRPANAKVCKGRVYTKDERVEACAAGKGSAKGGGKGDGTVDRKPGDWDCPTCGKSWREATFVCKHCSTENPSPNLGLRAQMDTNWKAGKPCFTCGAYGHKAADCKKTAGSGEAAPSENIYIKGLPLATTEESIIQEFTAYGKVTATKVMKGDESKVDGATVVGVVVRFSTVTEATHVVNTLNGVHPEGFPGPLAVKFAKLHLVPRV